MKEPYRERLIVFILGAQGSGKTTLATALVRAARARGERVSILDPNGKLPRGTFPASPVEREAWLEQRIERRDTTLLVCDDGDRYIRTPLRADSPWQKVALTNRHINFDVLVTGRRLQGFPGELISGIDYLYLFQVSSADTNGMKRLALVNADVQLPTQKYEFVRLEPKTATGNPVRGRTLARGGFEMEAR